MVSGSISMADDNSKERRAAVRALCLLPEIFGLGDKCGEHKQARGGQHDTAAFDGHQTWHDRARHVCGPRQQVSSTH